MVDDKIIIMDFDEIQIPESTFTDAGIDSRNFYLCPECFKCYCHFYDHRSRKSTNNMPFYLKSPIDKNLIKFNSKSSFERHFMNCPPQIIGKKIYEDDYIEVIKAEYRINLKYENIRTYNDFLKRVTTVFEIMIPGTKLCDRPQDQDCFFLIKKGITPRIIGFSRVLSIEGYSLDLKLFEGEWHSKKFDSLEEMEMEINGRWDFVEFKPIIEGIRRILTFSILPKYRCQGNGTLLMKEILNYYDSGSELIIDNISMNFKTYNTFQIESPNKDIMKLAKKFNLIRISCLC